LHDDLRFYSFSTASYMETTKITGNCRPNDIYSLAGDPDTPYPDGIHAQRCNRTNNFQIAGGFKGEVGGWNYGASSTWDEDDSTLNASNTLNPSWGPTSPTSFYLASQIFDQWTNNLDFKRGFDIGLKIRCKRRSASNTVGRNTRSNPATIPHIPQATASFPAAGFPAEPRYPASPPTTVPVRRTLAKSVATTSPVMSTWAWT
jgi:iron complex outermembrane receptor protein